MQPQPSPTAPAPDPTRLAWTRARRQRIALARDHFGAFCELVLKDEQTGAPIHLSEHHRKWIALLQQHDRLCLWSFLESGKSQILSIAYVLWRLGRDPSLRVAIVSNTHSQAAKLLRSVSRHIEQNEELKSIFPGLRPGPKWTDSAIEIRRQTISKDPSVQCLGIHGAVLGSRVDLLLVDDVLDFENCRTEEQRQMTWDWFHSSLMGRLTARAKAIVAGVAFHPEDLLHRLSRQSAWHSEKFAIEDEQTGAPTWPERWSKQRIEAKRLELGPSESARQLDCLARSDAEARFKLDWISMALQRGSGKRCMETLFNIPPGHRVTHGVDLGVSKKVGSDLSAIASVLIYPDGSRQLIALRSGRWSGPEILENIENVHRRYSGVVCVESVAAQAYVGQFLRARELNFPVRDFKTGRAKMSLEWQSELLAGELSNGKWIFPSDDGRVNHPEVSALCRDLLYYTPTAHTPDRMVALLLARWAGDTSYEAATFRLDTLSR